METRLTKLLGIKYPIIAGGLQWLANADYVSAAARAGIAGFITAASFPDLGELRAEIQKCRDQSQGNPFGVNVSMFPKLVEGERTQEVFDLIVEEGVKLVETSGRNPQPYLPQLKEADIKVIHKVPGVKFAKKAESLGVDAVTVIGAECGGHPGLDMVGTIVQANVTARAVSIPLIVGGGIGTGEQLVAALALGADGVIIGTRFLVAQEIWAHELYKQKLIDSNETDTTLMMQTLRNTMRALRNETTGEVQKIEAENPGDLKALMPHISGKVGKIAYETGDWTRGAMAVGQSVAFANKIEPLSSIVDTLMNEANTAMARLANLSGGLDAMRDAG
jgi:NAD(P)H-dependent flavin oxidoreductase YrpB (nitropropane dioxygenase family)